MFKGKAELAATKAFLEKHNVHTDQRRPFAGVEVSSLAIGTYLGPMDEITDHKVTQAVLASFDRGVNFVDSAINYRGQRAERSIGEAIKRAMLTKKITREEIFVSTKAGFIPYEGSPVPDIKKLFQENYVTKGVARMSDLIAGCHCMEPAFLLDQIERSRKNLGLETIDLFYLHNPETQLEELPARIFFDKLFEAFVMLESAVKDGKIAAYGMATWDAFRDEETAQTYVPLEKCVEIATLAAGKVSAGKHHFVAIQLPLNLAAPEAALLPNQSIGGKKLPAIDAAQELGLSIAVSIPLFQARLCHDLPDFIMKTFKADYSQAFCALSFATSWPAVNAAMVGMKDPAHVAHNLGFLQEPRLDRAQLERVSSAILE